MFDGLGPLGLILKKNLQSEKIDKVKWVADFDFTSVKYAYITEFPEKSPNVRLVARELKRFLTLSLLVESPKYNAFCPSEVVDEMWHTFILHTKMYRDFCDNVAGGYIDHNPPAFGGKKEGIALYSGEIFSQTKAELTELYGALPPYAWGISSRCDKPAPCMSWPSPTV